MFALFFVDGTKTILDCRDKENVEKKYNYIMKLLGEHGSFNRISFGDVLFVHQLLTAMQFGYHLPMQVYHL
jgi:hypothetical protein